MTADPKNQKANPKDQMRKKEQPPAAQPPRAGSRARTAVNSLVTGLAVAAVLILVNVLASGSRAKADLTENRIFTLTPASERMVRSLPEKVLVKAYIGNLPAEHAEKQAYVENLLAEYASASGGKLTWERIDPFGKPELQTELKKDGIAQMLLLTLKEDRQEQVPVYFAVVFQYLDKKEVWQAHQGGFSLAGLEYEFSSRIKRLAFGKKKVGVTAGFGEPDDIRALASVQVGLGDMYEVVPVPWKDRPEEIEKVDALVVNGPTNRVADAAQYHLDQHLMKGKPVLFLVRGTKWSQGGGQNPEAPEMPELFPEAQADKPWIGAPADHGLGPLLAHYGFEVGANTVIDPVDTAPGLLVMGRQALRIYGFAPVARVLASGRGEILEGIEHIAVPFASTVKLTGPLAGGTIEGGKVTPLLESGRKSFAKSDLIVLSREFSPKVPAERGPYALGYAASGKFRSFFAGKPKPDGVTAPPPAGEAPAALASQPPAGEPLAESPVSARVAILGSSEIVETKTIEMMQHLRTDVYWNGFIAFHNLVDWLVADQELVAVRSKEIARPLGGVDKGDRALVKWGNVAGPPVALVAFGVIYWRTRVRRRRGITL